LPRVAHLRHEVRHGGRAVTPLRAGARPLQHRSHKKSPEGRTMKTRPMDPSRRGLLAGGAALAAAAVGREALAQAPAAAAPGKPALPAYVSWKSPEAVIVHTATTIETKRSAFGTSIITPAD